MIRLTMPASAGNGALIYQGTATAYGDAEAIQSILDSHGVRYKIYDSAGMNQLSLDEIAQYDSIIWPGGYGGLMSNSLYPETRERIRKAVNERGVSYVGICAGAFLAVGPDTSYGFGLVRADSLLPYYHLENEGVEHAMVEVIRAKRDSTQNSTQNSARSLVWWGGPTLPEFPNGVVARYADDKTPAIAQTWAGKGLVVLSGPHPEAPQSWRTKLGLNDTDGLDQDWAWDLFEAGLNKKPLETFN